MIIPTVDNSRGSTLKSDCTHCKYLYERHCRIDDKIRLCSTCEHRAKHKMSSASTACACLCLLKPTKTELKTGKCKYFVRADDNADS